MYHDLKHIGNRIVIRRNELGITQGELAESLNISNTHLSNIERGKKPPSFLLFLDICSRLKINSDYLTAGKVYVDLDEELEEKIKRCTQEQRILISTVVDAFLK